MQPESMVVACVLLLTAFISKCLFLLLFLNDLPLILRERQGGDWPFRLYLILSQKSGLFEYVIFWFFGFVFLI